jgi:hypothetical protein
MHIGPEMHIGAEGTAIGAFRAAHFSGQTRECHQQKNLPMKENGRRR